MTFIIAIISLALISSLIMPWINLLEIKRLRKIIYQLKYGNIVAGETENKGGPLDLQSSENNAKNGILGTKINNNEESITIRAVESSSAVEIVNENKKVVKTKSKSIINFERKFLTHLPIWIGGFSLALAGLFLVKYSIDKNLLSPIARIILSLIFAIVLIFCAEIIHNKPNFANGVRITQSLSGAGIAILYAVSFASARLYEIIPAFSGVIAMAAVTLTALSLSLRYGAPMALLGMMVGFLSPFLFDDTQKDAITLFIYLYFVTSGFLFVARKNNWWWLAITAIVISMLWVTVWTMLNQDSGDGVCAILFFCAISATMFFASRKQYKYDSKLSSARLSKPSFIINHIGLSVALVLMVIFAKKNAFDSLEWSLFSVIAICTIVIAYLDEKLYGFLPWLSMTINVTMLNFYNPQDKLYFVLILAAFSFIYTVSGYFIMLKSRLPILWAKITGISTLLFYFTGYFKLRGTEISLDWSIIGLVIGSLAVLIISRVKKTLSQYELVQHIYTIFAIVATTAISTAIFMKIDQKFLPVILTVEILAISWISTKTYVNCLRKIIKVLFCVFIIAILQQLFFVSKQILFSLMNLELSMSANFSFFERPIFYLGMPAVSLFASSYFLKKQKEDGLVKIFEISSTLLFSIMLYYLIHGISLTIQIQNSFLERGIFTNALFIWGLSCLYISKKLKRDSFFLSGSAICFIAISIIVYFDMIFQNPIWHNQKIVGILFFNSLLLTYGLPILYTGLAKNKLIELKKQRLTSYLDVFIMISAFILVNLNVRYIFHGQYLATGVSTEFETYTYSAVWLIISLVLLFLGAVKKNQSLHHFSLALLILTIGKVFLYDASSLEGLYRVFSFLGLGISLVGIGYFYARFIFKVTGE